MKKFFKDVLTSALAKLIVVGLLALLTLAWDAVKDIDYGTTIVNFLTYSIPLWIILVAIFVLWVVVVAYKLNKQMPFESVTETTDAVMGFRWRWEWKKNADGKYDVYNFHPVCSRCNEIMSIEWGEREYKCVNGHVVRSTSVDGIRACRHVVEQLKLQFPKYRTIITSKLV